MRNSESPFLLQTIPFILPEWQAPSDTEYILPQAIAYNRVLKLN